MCAYNQFCFKGDLTVFERKALRKYQIAADGAVGLLKRSESGGGGRSVEAKRKRRGEFPRINLWGYGSREKTVKD